MTRVFLLLAMAVVAASSAGCEDSCRTAESRCDSDHAVERCIESDGFLMNHWGEVDDCAAGKFCVELIDPDDGVVAAWCTSSPDPDPRCPPEARSYSTCADSRTVLRCSSGYGDEFPCSGQCLIDADGVTARCVHL